MGLARLRGRHQYVVVPLGLSFEVFAGVNRGVVLAVGEVAVKAVGEVAVKEGLGLNRGIVEPNLRVAPIAAFGLTARVGSCTGCSANSGGIQ